jgi:glycosyltransferase 2 family protein
MSVRFSAPVRRALMVFLGAACALFITLAVVASVGDIPDVDLRLAPAWLALAVVSFLVFQVLVMEVWVRVLREVGGELERPKAYAIYSVSLLTRYVPTQLPMAISRVELGVKEGVPRSVTVAGIAYEVILGLATACALSVGFLVSLDGVRDSPARWAILVAPAVLLALLHPRVVVKLERSVAARLHVEAHPVAVPVRRLLPLVGIYLVMPIAAGAATWAMARGLAPVELPGTTALTAYAVGSATAVAAFMLPAGLGARDVAIATALSASMSFSVALTAAIVVRLVQTAIELLYAGATSFWARRSVRSAP